MGFLIGIWDGIKAGLEFVLRFYEGLMEPFVGEVAWGLAIILLTVTVRIFMIPLMVRQTKSMRAMQTIQPELKKVQEKYKADRSMMKTDPDRYRKLKEKQREAQMELYQEHGVNPVGGCLPLLLQMPVFLALFQVLQNQGSPLAEDLAGASFLGFDSLTDSAAGILGAEGGIVIAAAVSAVLLIVLQVGTTFWSQKQMMARNTTAAAEQAQVQKIMLYIMPVFLGYLSFTFPIGVVLYWVTTNFWTMGQQAFIFRKVEAQEAQKAEEREAAKIERAQRKHVEEVTGKDEGTGTKGSGKGGSKGRGGNTAASGGGKGANRAKGGGPSGNGRGGSGGSGGANGGKQSVSGASSSKDSSKDSSSKGPSSGVSQGGSPTPRQTRRARAAQRSGDGGSARNGRPASGGSTGSPPDDRPRPKGNRSKPGSTR